MRHLIVPQPIGVVLEGEPCGVPDRPHAQEELVAVLRAVIEPPFPALRQRGILLRPEENVEPEVRVQHERAAVIRVIAEKEVGHGRFGRSGLDRRMRIDDARRSVKPGIRNAPDAHLAVIVGDILQQPVHRVVHVAAVVHVVLRFFVVNVRPHFQERAFRHVASAHVLKNENVPRALEFVRRPQRLPIIVHAVGPHAIGRALHQKWISARLVLRDVHRGKEQLAVAHRDAELVLRVVLANVKFRRRVASRPRPQKRHAN